jgi:hypothetical protein
MKSALILFGFAASLAATAAAAADLSGLVTAEHDGSPVVAAAITLRSEGKVVAELETDSSGIFKAAKLPAAEYVVSIAKASYTAAERRVTLTDKGADVTLQIAKLGVISGRVLDRQGKGIRNMVVAAIPAPADGGPPALYNTRPTGAVTDSNGRYRVFGLPAGNYYAVALAGNPRSQANVTNGLIADTSHGNTAQMYPTVLPIHNGDEQSNINFTGYSGPLFSIKGIVIGPGPDTPYRVSLVAEGVGIPVADATAQPGKEFQFDRVAPGTYKIVASRLASSGLNIADLINSGQIVVTAANQEAILRELQLSQSVQAAQAKGNAQKIEPAFGETTVTVVTQDLTGVTLAARPGIEPKLLYQAAYSCPTSVQLTLSPVEYMGTGSSGRSLTAGVETALPAMAPAMFAVSVNLPADSGCYAQTTRIDFRNFSSGSVIPIVVGKLGLIRGKVDTTGYLPEEFQIVMTAPDGIVKRTFALAKDSTFTIPNLRPGRYRVTATRRSANRVIASDQDVPVGSGETAQVEFPALP